MASSLRLGQLQQQLRSFFVKVSLQETAVQPEDWLRCTASQKGQGTTGSLSQLSGGAGLAASDLASCSSSCAALL